MNINNTQTRSQESAYALEPRVYELGYHILPNVDEGNLGKEREALVAIITKFKGIVISEEMPALIDLAYDMDKIIDNKRNIFSQAYFGWIKFELAPESIIALEKDVDALATLLRFILIKTIRENTIISDVPYKLARKQNAINEESEIEDDGIERPVADSAPVTNDELKCNDCSDDTDCEKCIVTKTSEDEIITESDDLTKIEGIGPKIAEIFATAGIKTFEDLSSSKVGDLRDILEENKLASHDPKTWSKQATLAKNGKWDKLAELQDELNGGK